MTVDLMKQASLSEATTIDCPKCGHAVPALNECTRCGVVFAKVQRPRGERPTAPRPAERNRESEDFERASVVFWFPNFPCLVILSIAGGVGILGIIGGSLDPLTPVFWLVTGLSVSALDLLFRAAVVRPSLVLSVPSAGRSEDRADSRARSSWLIGPAGGALVAGRWWCPAWVFGLAWAVGMGLVVTRQS